MNIGKRMRSLAAGEITGEIKQLEYGFAADRIAELERQLSAEKKRASAQAMLINSQEKQLTDFGKRQDEWREAVKTLDSERAANAELTRQLAERGGAVGEVVFNANGFKEVRFDARKLPAGALLYTGPQVPEGWQIVPKLATNKMLSELHGTYLRGESLEAAYRALLAAAPQPGVKP